MLNSPRGSARDFDFLSGDWTLFNRRLVTRLAGCQEWQEFPGTLTERSVLGGLGSLGEFRAVIGGREVIGMPLRLFQPHNETWRLHWIDTVRTELEPPLVGAFVDGRGVFFGDDTWEGKKVRVRVVWHAVSDSLVTYEQAYSIDGGANWETNWTIRLLRKA